MTGNQRYKIKEAFILLNSALLSLSTFKAENLSTDSEIYQTAYRQTMDARAILDKLLK